MWKRRKEELYPYFFGSDLKAVEGPVNEPQQKNEEIFIYRLSHTHLLMFSTSQQATPYLIICKGKQNCSKNHYKYNKCAKGNGDAGPLHFSVMYMEILL